MILSKYRPLIKKKKGFKIDGCDVAKCMCVINQDYKKKVVKVNIVF